MCVLSIKVSTVPSKKVLSLFFLFVTSCPSLVLNHFRRKKKNCYKYLRSHFNLFAHSICEMFNALLGNKTRIFLSFMVSCLPLTLLFSLYVWSSHFKDPINGSVVLKFVFILGRYFLSYHMLRKSQTFRAVSIIAEKGLKCGISSVKVIIIMTHG